MTQESQIESIGIRLRRLRLERGLSQRELEAPGVSFSYISRIESGARQPSVKALRVLAAKLSVSPEYLETGQEFDPRSELELRLRDAELELRLDDVAAAEQKLRTIVNDALAAGEGELADRARICLGIAAAHQGRDEEGVEVLEGVIRDGHPDVVERPDLYGALARSYAELGETPKAVALLETSLERIRATERTDDMLFIRFASYLSYALMDIGDTARAHESLSEALRRASGIEDPETLTRLYWSLGRYYASEGPARLALDYFRRAIAVLETTEDRFFLARAHEAVATLLLDQASPDSAQRHLEVAERLFEELFEPGEIGSVRTEWARLSLQEGDVARAREHALEALDLLENSEPASIGRTWRTLAGVFVELGEPDLVHRCYETAIQVLTTNGPPGELAETYRSYGKFLRGIGQEVEALDAFERAADLSSRVTADSAPSVLETPAERDLESLPERPAGP